MQHAAAVTALHTLRPSHFRAIRACEHLRTLDGLAEAAGAIRAPNPLIAVDARAEAGASAVVAEHTDLRAGEIWQALEFKAGVVDEVVAVAGVRVGEAKVDRAIAITVIPIHAGAWLAAGRERNQRRDHRSAGGGLHAVVVIVHPIVQSHDVRADGRIEGWWSGNADVIDSRKQVREEVHAVGVRQHIGSLLHIIAAAVFQHAIGAGFPKLDAQGRHAALRALADAVVVDVHEGHIAHTQSLHGHGDGQVGAFAVVNVRGLDGEAVAAERGGRSTEHTGVREAQSGWQRAADKAEDIRRVAIAGRESLRVGHIAVCGGCRGR